MGIIKFIFGTDISIIRKERFNLKEFFKATIIENKAIDAKAAKIRKETWKMIRQLEPKIKELGKKIKVKT